MPRTAGRRSSRCNQWRRFEVSGVSGATGDRRPTFFYVRNHLGFEDAGCVDFLRQKILTEPASPTADNAAPFATADQQHSSREISL